MDANEIRRLIAHHRKVIEGLEEELRHVESGGTSWVPQRFYTAYYILAGVLIGIAAAWVTLILNVLGSWLIDPDHDPLKLMRVYATVFAGREALGTNQAAILMLSAGIHTLTGAVCGAPIHVVVSRFFPGLELVARVIAGIVLGIVMWVVNFYGILSWLQPLLVEETIIIRDIPVWVAILNHVAFTLLVLLMQPLGTFTLRGDAQNEQA